MIAQVKAPDTAGTRISIVIVTWNSKEIVRECLQSLERHAAGLDVETTVVDNTSSDGTPELMVQRFPMVRLVRNPVNAGFARANNIGLRLSTGKYLCLINSDVVLSDDCLERMMRHMDANPDIGVLSPRMRLKDGSIGASCMRFPSVWNWFCRALALDSVFSRWRLFGGYLMTDFRYDREADIEVITCWFWMVRREALDSVGLLDEQFFMYGEDIDWSKRFHDAGWRVVFYPDAEAFHYCGGSSTNAPVRFYVEMNRANMQYFRRHHNNLAVAGFWVATILHSIVRIAGYSFLYALHHAHRGEAAAKVRRSAACLLWLIGAGGQH